jgi:hypothetical protein
MTTYDQFLAKSAYVHHHHIADFVTAPAWKGIASLFDID